LHETIEATKAIAIAPGVCYLRLDKSWAPPTDGVAPFVLGRARQRRDGDALTIVACGGIVGEALTAADALLTQGIAVRVLSMHTIKPLDSDALMAASRDTGGILTVEEHVAEGGLGSAVAEALLDGGAPPRRFRRLALRGGFVSAVGSQEYLRHQCGIDAPAISLAVRQLLDGVRP
jgi:transketolase